MHQPSRINSSHQALPHSVVKPVLREQDLCKTKCWLNSRTWLFNCQIAQCQHIQPNHLEDYWPHLVGLGEFYRQEFNCNCCLYSWWHRLFYVDPCPFQGLVCWIKRCLSIVGWCWGLFCFVDIQYGLSPCIQNTRKWTIASTILPCLNTNDWFHLKNLSNSRWGGSRTTHMWWRSDMKSVRVNVWPTLATSPQHTGRRESCPHLNHWGYWLHGELFRGIIRIQ